MPGDAVGEIDSDSRLKQLGHIILGWFPVALTLTIIIYCYYAYVVTFCSTYVETFVSDLK